MYSKFKSLFVTTLQLRKVFLILSIDESEMRFLVRSDLNFNFFLSVFKNLQFRIPPGILNVNEDTSN